MNSSLPLPNPIVSEHSGNMMVVVGRADRYLLGNFGKKCQLQQTLECYSDFIKNVQIQRLFKYGDLNHLKEKYATSNGAYIPRRQFDHFNALAQL